MNLPDFPQVDLFVRRHQRPERSAWWPVILRITAATRLRGLLIMAYFGGIGGGVSRDLLLNDIPDRFRARTILSCAR